MVFSVGRVGEIGEVLVAADSKMKANSKDDSIPSADPPKAKVRTALLTLSVKSSLA